MSTDRLYYNDPFLNDFTAEVKAVREIDGRKAVALNRSAFYPTSGGQVFDTGWLDVGPGGEKLRVSEVAEAPENDGNGDDKDEVLHIIETTDATNVEELVEGVQVRGYIDVDRRRDHMQQHTGQHVLSAAFIRLFNMPTVSFHMGAESCTIDLDTKGVSDEQLRAVEQEANRIIFEDRPVAIKYALAPEARAMGVRKIPSDISGELRLIDIKDYDLNACGGTHVRATGQIGAILLRKTEKVRQGVRVEFVCGLRAVNAARRDYESLVKAGALFSAHIHDVPSQISKLIEDNKAQARERKRLTEEVAAYYAPQLLQEGEQREGYTLLARVFTDREVTDIKLLAQKATASAPSVVLLGATQGQPGLVFAQTPGLPFDMGALMRQAMAELGGRGGGTKDMGQGGAPDATKIRDVIGRIAQHVA
jgi:alanyl-tRNA synthetase